MTDYLVVERKIDIAAPTAQVQNLITDFHNWRDWSPWEDLDPNLERTYKGPDSGVGAQYEWSGNKKAGAGMMEIKAIAPTQIAVDLNFTRPFKSDSKTTFDFQDRGQATTVVWQVHTPKTLMVKIFSIFMKLDKTVGGDLEKGLAQLKAAAEK